MAAYEYHVVNEYDSSSSDATYTVCVQSGHTYPRPSRENRQGHAYLQLPRLHAQVPGRYGRQSNV